MNAEIYNTEKVYNYVAEWTPLLIKGYKFTWLLIGQLLF